MGPLQGLNLIKDPLYWSPAGALPHKRSTLLVPCRRFHRWPVVSRHTGPAIRKALIIRCHNQGYVIIIHRVAVNVHFVWRPYVINVTEWKVIYNCGIATVSWVFKSLYLCSTAHSGRHGSSKAPHCCSTAGRNHWWPVILLHTGSAIRKALVDIKILHY